MSRRPSFTDRRRARLARRVDALEAMEARSMITESLGVLSLGIGVPALLAAVAPAATAGSAAGGPRRARRDDAGAITPATPPRPAPAAPAATGAARTGVAVPAPAVAPAPAGDWITLFRPASGPGRPWKPSAAQPPGPSPGAGGGAAGSSHGGGGAVAPAAITPLRLPPPAQDVGAPAPVVTGGASPSPVPAPQAGRSAAAKSPSPVGVGTAGHVVPDYDEGVPELFIEDYSHGVLFQPGAEQLATLGGLDVLYAEIHLFNEMDQATRDPIITYTWDASGMTHGSIVTNYDDYNGQPQGIAIRWNNTNATAAVDSLTLTAAFLSGGGSVQETVEFYVPAGTGTTNNATPTWPLSYSPGAVLPVPPAASGLLPYAPGAFTGDGTSPADGFGGGMGSTYGDGRVIPTENASIVTDTAAIETTLQLPSYSPNVAPLALQYDSRTADFGSGGTLATYVVVHYTLPSGSLPPDELDFQLIYGSPAIYTSTPYFVSVDQLSNFGIGQLNLGGTIEVDLPVAASQLAAYGYYGYTVKVANVTITGGVASYATFTYDSGYDVVAKNDGSAFGPGWELAGLDRIANVSSSGVILDTGNGSLRFGTAGTSYTSPVGDHSTLSGGSSAGWVRTLKDGTQEAFNTSGQETGLVDTNGRRTTYAYNGSGSLATIKDPYSNVTTFTYDSGGLLATIKDPAGRLTTFAHSGGTELTSAQLPDLSTWSYAYSGSYLTRITDPRSQAVTFSYQSGFATGVTRSDGSTEAFSPYQLIAFGNGANVTWETAAGLSMFAQTYSEYTDPLGRVSDFYFDWQGLGLADQGVGPAGTVLTQDRDQSANVTVTIDPMNRVTTWAFDGSGNVLTEAYPDASTESWSYNGFSEVTARKSPDGGTTTYTYDSHGNLTGTHDPLGNLTTMSYTTRGELATAKDARGYTTSYSYDSQDRLTTVAYPDGTGETLSYSSAGMATGVVDRDGHATTASYDAMDRPTGRTDALGGKVTLTYDADGDLATSKDQLGRVTSYAYDPMDRLTTITDPLAGTTAFGYDSGGRPVTATDPLGHRTTYAYDSDDNVTTITDPLGQVTRALYDADGELTTLTDAANRVGTYAYDARGRLATSTDPLGKATSYGYDADGNLTRVTDPLGRVTTYVYDLLDRAIEEMLPLGINSYAGYDSGGNLAKVTDPLGLITTFTYNPVNRLVTAKDPLGNVTSYGYDPAGNLTTVTDPLSRVTTLAYDALNRVTTVTDPLGHATTYSYDAVGNETRQADPLGRVTSYAYDALDRLTTLTDPLAHATTFAYDAASNRTGMTDADGHRTTYSYDADNQLIGVADPLNHTTSFGYDPVGNRTSVTDGNGLQATFGYDGDDRLVTAADPAGDRTTYAYDAAGQLTTVTDPRGYATRYAYDPAGRQTTMTDALGGVTTSAYDLDGRTTGLTDPVGNRTTWAYDSGGRTVAVTNPMGYQATYAYDADGELTAKTDASGRRTTYAYDSGGRNVNEYWVSSSGGRLAAITHAYDADGEMTGAADASGLLSFAYDSGGRATSAATSGTLGQPLVTLTYGYDAVGNRTGLSDSLTNQGVTSYAYDAADRLTTLTESFGAAVGPVVTLGYDAGDRVTTILRTESGTAFLPIATTLAYDNAGRVTAINNRYGTSTRTGFSLDSFAYTYDADGDVATSNDNGGSTFSYNADDELTGVSGGTHLTYTYDSGGNRTMTGYSAAAGDEMSASPGYTYTYDHEGNLAAKTQASTGNHWAYAYDYRDRLTGVTETSSGGTVLAQATYTYDALDRRIGIDDNSTQAWTVYDGETPYADFTGAGVLTTRYLSAAAAGGLVARTDSGGTTSWYLTDRQGSVRDVVSVSGSVLDQIGYDAYGNITSESTPASGGRFKYAGLVQDAAAGLDLAVNRAYDPTTGRWISQDPLGFAGGDTDLYRYAGNNPATLIDPSGLKAAHAIERPDGTMGLEYRETNSPEQLKAGDSPPGFFGRNGVYIGGGLQTVGGVLEIGGGLIALASLGCAPNPYTAVGGVALLINGLDNFASGVATFVTGEAHDTLTVQSIGLGIQGASQLGPVPLTKEESLGFARTVGGFYGLGLSSGLGYALRGVSCFPPGTLVSTEGGLRPISSVGAGDRVWSYDFVEGSWRLAAVERRQDSIYEGELVTLDLGVGEATATAFHPFWVVEGEDLEARPAMRHVAVEEDRGGKLAGRWVDSHELREGDVVFLRAVGPVTIRRIEMRHERMPVCNLTVPGLHTFAVGEAQALVHNTPNCAPGANAPSNGRFVYDPKISRYRDTTTGRLVAQRDLPFPPNRGFSSSSKGTLQPGTTIDRYGRNSGRFVGDVGDSLSQRGLPAGSDALEYHRFEVLKPIGAEIGPTAGVPEFGASGGGTQYLFGRSISDLIRDGFLREIP